jgi:hypothetical protein
MSFFFLLPNFFFHERNIFIWPNLYLRPRSVLCSRSGNGKLGKFPLGTCNGRLVLHRTVCMTNGEKFVRIIWKINSGVLLGHMITECHYTLILKQIKLWLIEYSFISCQRIKFMLNPTPLMIRWIEISRYKERVFHNEKKVFLYDFNLHFNKET